MVELTDTKPIEAVQTIVQFAKYPTQIQALSPESKYYHLLVGPGNYMSAPGTYDPNRFVAVDVAFLNDVYQHTGIEPNPKADYLQFLIELPFQIPAEKHKEAYQLLSFFNLLVPMGSFNIHANGTPYYRYSYLINLEQEVEGLVVIEALNTLMFFVENLGHKIESLANDKKSLKTLLNEKISFDNRPK